MAGPGPPPGRSDPVVQFELEDGSLGFTAQLSGHMIVNARLRSPGPSGRVDLEKTQLWDLTQPLGNAQLDTINAELLKAVARLVESSSCSTWDEFFHGQLALEWESALHIQRSVGPPAPWQQQLSGLRLVLWNPGLLFGRDCVVHACPCCVEQWRQKNPDSSDSLQDIGQRLKGNLEGDGYSQSCRVVRTGNSSHEIFLLTKRWKCTAKSELPLLYCRAAML